MFLVQEDGSFVSVNDDQLLSFADLSNGDINTDVAGTVQALAESVNKMQQRLEYCISLQVEMLRRLTLNAEMSSTTNAALEAPRQSSGWPQFKIIDTYADAIAFEENLKEPSFIEQNVR